MRKQFLLVPLVLIVGFLAYAAFVPKTYTHSVEIPHSLMKIDEQLSLPVNIIRWYVPFSSAARGDIKFDTAATKIIYKENELALSHTAVVGATYEVARNADKKTFVFSIQPDSANETKVSLAYKSTLLNKWLVQDDLAKNAKKSLQQLKSYMEDTKSLYGFEIKFETVSDSSFLFKTQTVPNAERSTAMKKLFDELVEYANEKNANFTGVRIFYSQPRTNGQTELYAGIGVNNRVQTMPGADIQYKQMPFGKNLLTAFYQGPYGKVGDAYDALQQFKSDHNLVSMAIPFEKFIGNNYNFTDDQVVQLKVYYPIF